MRTAGTAMRRGHGKSRVSSRHEAGDRRDAPWSEGFSWRSPPSARSSSPLPTPHAAIRYVVAAHSVEPGTRLTTADLTTVPVDLPPEQAALAFTEPSTLVGTTSLGPLGAGQLVQAPALARGPLSPFEVSLSVDSDRALDGHLVSGEHVAVLATYGSGPDAVTLTVASSRAGRTALETDWPGSRHQGRGDARPAGRGRRRCGRACGTRRRAHPGAHRLRDSRSSPTSPPSSPTRSRQAP